MDSYRVLRYAICHLAFSLLFSLYSAQGRLRNLAIEANVESGGKFNHMNRNAVKTIKTRYGDEYDCVELYKQPALHHKLLKNHKIQGYRSQSYRKWIFGHLYRCWLHECCPSGTVPIRRTQSRAEILRAKALFRQQFRSFHTSTESTPTGFVFAGIGTGQKEATVYYGTGGLVSINNPTVSNGQLSASVISIEGGPPNQFSVVRVGWMQGEDGKMHGCYNTYCSGFVQTDAQIALDMILEPVSVVRGPQFYVKLAVSQDKSTGNWWLIYGENNTSVGYWPSSLFYNLEKGADALRWGGMVYSNTDQLPAMGNGDHGKIHSSHFRQIVLQYESGTSLNGTIGVPLEVRQTRCYKCGDNSYKSEFWGYSFYFGGDGGDLTRCSKSYALSEFDFNNH
ncbi:hypothetical protein DITRI_Ditri03aG0138000 [Diplodiscus trichospermus]